MKTKIPKIIAQRKFAQGAYIPPQTSVVPDRRPETRAPEEKNVIHNNLSPRNLLDLVSFKNVHNHTRPFVLLERLQQPSPKIAKVAEPLPKKSHVEVVQERKSTPTVKKATKKNLANNSVMCLRSRQASSANNFKISKRRLGDKKTLAVRKCRELTTAITRIRRAATVPSSSNGEFVADDDRPLTYFKEQPSKRKANVVRGALTSRSKAKVKRVQPVAATSKTNKTVKNCAFYGSNEIQNWINKSVQQDKAIFQKPQKPAPRVAPQIDSLMGPPPVPRRRELPNVQLSARSNESAQSKCPSAEYSTVKDILEAAKRGEDRHRCKNCTPCHRVGKIHRISELLNVNQSTIEDSPRLHYKQENNEVASLHTSCAPEVLASSENRVYLDLMRGQSTHIIELTWSKISNSDKNMMRARLVQRSSANVSNEFSVVEHEGLLDQLLATLDPNSESNVPAKGQADNKRLSDVSVSVGLAEKEVTETVPQKSKRTTSRSNKQVNAGTSGSTLKNTSKKSKAKESPKAIDNAKIVDAPIFHPTKEEFEDPIAYFEKIMPIASKFGLCKVVPPKNFKPTCTLDDEIQFSVSRQYISRLYHRWGAAARELSAIKAYLALQGVHFSRAPLLEGLEVNLPKLYHLVQRHGGLQKVFERNLWTRIAVEMHFTKVPNPEKKLDMLYVKYILPYDTSSNQERQQITVAVERAWRRRHARMLERALDPLRRQKQLLGEAEESDDEPDDAPHVALALTEAEDCVVSGRNMTLAAFKKTAANAMHSHFSSTRPTAEQAESEYWRIVLQGSDHVCVNTASIDTGDEGYGFPTNASDPYSKHPWNLKMISENAGNMLRSLGPVLGVTVPTLHLGMVFSTSCWHRDPHGLPWLEYMHSGPGKIWYGIPDEQSGNFRKAVETLCPTCCQNKSIWLPSDITMIPPTLLQERSVSLSRLVQEPGEYVIVFPKAYSCSISVGYTVSESVYFATKSWLWTVRDVFQELRDSCEPSMFCLEQLAMSQARAPAAALPVLRAALSAMLRAERTHRAALRRLAVPENHEPLVRPQGTAWNVRDEAECEICRATLYLSKVVGLTSRKSAHCLSHALRLIKSREQVRQLANSIAVVTFYTLAELENLNVQTRTSDQ